MRFHDFIQEGPEWQTLESNETFANPFAEVHIVKVRTPTRPDGAVWTVIHRKGACVVVPVTPEGKLLLVRQERIPVRATIWEFPAGQIDLNRNHTEEVIRETALRELREESGHELAPGGELIPLGVYFSSPGVMDEHNHLFMARSVIPSPRGTDHDANEAIIGCSAFTPEEFREMIVTGEIRDANTLAAFARMTAMGLLGAG